MDYIFVRLSLTYLPANNLRRISTMYVRGYLQGSENGRVVTIALRLLIYTIIILFNISKACAVTYVFNK